MRRERVPRGLIACVKGNRRCIEPTVHSHSSAVPRVRALCKPPLVERGLGAAGIFVRVEFQFGSVCPLIFCSGPPVLTTSRPDRSSGPAAPTTTPTQSASGTATASSSATYSPTRTLAGTRCAICRAMGSALCKGGLTARYGTQGLRFQNQENSQIGPNQFKFLCCCSCTTASIGYLKPLLEHCGRHA